MPFSVAAEAYDRYIGRYPRALAPRFLDFAQVAAGPILDVGGGPGSLTSAPGFDLVRTFCQAARRFDAGAPDDARLPFRRMAELTELWHRTGLHDVTAAIGGPEGWHVDPAQARSSPDRNPQEEP